MISNCDHTPKTQYTAFVKAVNNHRSCGFNALPIRMASETKSKPRPSKHLICYWRNAPLQVSRQPIRFSPAPYGLDLCIFNEVYHYQNDVFYNRYDSILFLKKITAALNLWGLKTILCLKRSVLFFPGTVYPIRHGNTLSDKGVSIWIHPCGG